MIFDESEVQKFRKDFLGYYVIFDPSRGEFVKQEDGTIVDHKANTNEVNEANPVVNQNGGKFAEQNNDTVIKDENIAVDKNKFSGAPEHKKVGFAEREGNTSNGREVDAFVDPTDSTLAQNTCNNEQDEQEINVSIGAEKAEATKSRTVAFDEHCVVTPVGLEKRKNVKSEIDSIDELELNGFKDGREDAIDRNGDNESDQRKAEAFVKHEDSGIVDGENTPNAVDTSAVHEKNAISMNSAIVLNDQIEARLEKMKNYLRKAQVLVNQILQWEDAEFIVLLDHSEAGYPFFTAKHVTDILETIKTLDRFELSAKFQNNLSIFKALQEKTHISDVWNIKCFERIGKKNAIAGYQTLLITKRSEPNADSH